MAWYNPASWGKTDTRRRIPYRRNYTGASSSRLFANFLGSSTSADKEIRPALRKMRDRVRQLTRNEPIATKALQIYRTQVVGDKGLRLQVRARNLPTSTNPKGALDISGNDIVETLWKEFCQKGICEVSQRHSFIDCQQLVIEGLIRDGEVLVKHVRNADNKFGYSLQFLEPDYLDEEYNTTLKNGNRIVMGVELNTMNRPIAYHLFDGAHPYDDIGKTAGRVRVPASDLLHIYRPDRAQQTRGVSAFHSVMDKIHMLNGYAEAELVASRLSASKPLVLETQDGTGYAGDSFEEEAPVMLAEAGSIMQIPNGMSLKSVDTDHPNSGYGEFHKSILRSIATGLGVDYVTLSSNLESVSYSSIRSGTIESRDNYRMHQQFLIDHFALPVFREWLNLGMTAGAIPFPMERYNKFANNALFRPRGYQWVDPQREVQANINALQNGFITFTDVAQAVSGRDVEEVFSTLQSDLEMAERFGLKINIQPLGQKAPAQPEVNENGNDDE